MNIDIIIEDDRWSSVKLKCIAFEAVSSVLSQLKIFGENYEVAILACNDQTIRNLNKKFRSKEAVTNVLSWPNYLLSPTKKGETPCLPPDSRDLFESLCLGNIAISFDTCRSESKTMNRSIESHVTHLLMHSTLHLLGYTHEMDKDARLMERVEKKSLEALGISNPYLN